MSIFVRLETDDLEEIQKHNKIAKNSLLNLKNSTFSIIDSIKEKEGLINKARSTINDCHQELARLVSLMPQVEPLTSLKINASTIVPLNFKEENKTLSNIPFGKRSRNEKRKILEELGNRISKLK